MLVTGGPSQGCYTLPFTALIKRANELPTFLQGSERELEARQRAAEAADKERKAAAQRHQRDLAQEAARLQGIADQQQVFF